MIAIRYVLRYRKCDIRYVLLHCIFFFFFKKYFHFSSNFQLPNIPWTPGRVFRNPPHPNCAKIKNSCRSNNFQATELNKCFLVIIFKYLVTFLTIMTLLSLLFAFNFLKNWKIIDFLSFSLNNYFWTQFSTDFRAVWKFIWAILCTSC